MAKALAKNYISSRERSMFTIYVISRNSTKFFFKKYKEESFLRRQNQHLLENFFYCDKHMNHRIR